MFSCLIFGQSNADDLMKALSDAYYKNHELNAERESLNISKQELDKHSEDSMKGLTDMLDNLPGEKKGKQ